MEKKLNSEGLALEAIHYDTIPENELLLVVQNKHYYGLRKLCTGNWISSEQYMITKVTKTPQSKISSHGGGGTFR